MLLVNIKLFDINFKNNMKSLEVYLCDLPYTIFGRLGVYINFCNSRKNYCYLVCVWLQIENPVYFTIRLIFATIHGPHCTFWYYLWVSFYYFS